MVHGENGLVDGLESVVDLGVYVDRQLPRAGYRGMDLSRSPGLFLEVIELLDLPVDQVGPLLVSLEDLVNDPVLLAHLLDLEGLDFALLHGEVGVLVVGLGVDEVLDSEVDSSGCGLLPALVSLC